MRATANGCEWFFVRLQPRIDANRHEGLSPIGISVIKPSSGPCGCWDVAQTRRMGISKRWEQPAKCAEVFALPFFLPFVSISVHSRLFSLVSIRGCSHRFVVQQTIIQGGKPLIDIVVAHGTGQSPLLSNKDHHLPASSDGGVNQVTLQEQIVLHG